LRCCRSEQAIGPLQSVLSWPGNPGHDAFGECMSMQLIIPAIAIALWLLTLPVRAEDGFPKEQIAAGAELYATNCSPCHGSRMLDPEGAFNLRKFPHDQHDRFVNSVSRGKNQMPPWGDFFKPEQIEALWAYVVAGER
jgi:mono/diheme cytochrome c family protein